MTKIKISRTLNAPISENSTPLKLDTLLNSWYIFVKGIPEPQARPRRGKYGNFYSPKTDWHENLYFNFKQARPLVPFDGPLEIDIFFLFPHTKDSKKKKLYWHSVKPDEDNLKKVCYDMLQKANVIVNDSRIVKS